jgi:hypothetical protein
MKKLYLLFLLIPFLLFAETITVSEFQQQIKQSYDRSDGLPGIEITQIAVTGDQTVFAATTQGLARFDGRRWQAIQAIPAPISSLASQGNTLIIAAGQEPVSLYRMNARGNLEAQKELALTDKVTALHLDDRIYIGTAQELYTLDSDMTSDPAPKHFNRSVSDIATDPSDRLVVASQQGLFEYSPSTQSWQALYPRQGDRAWAPNAVAGVGFDKDNRLWFASPQGLAVQEQGQWSLYTGQEGLPYNQFTCLDLGKTGVWTGTTIGVVHYDKGTWEYRQGKRWLPDDRIHDIAVDAQGNAWTATSRGVGVIKHIPMTLAKKAEYYESEIDKYHRRTPYEYVLGVSVAQPGDKSEYQQHDSDNDGLWTAMYGAGECFAYAATGDPKAKARAKKAFEALHFLREVHVDAPIAPPSGYVARTILPTSGPDPNKGRLEGDLRRKAKEDTLWKTYEPRWPKSKDGKWYYKTDTSSDELDGHYFLYALYYDLVAESEQERQRVRDHVRLLTDHLVRHNFQLVDVDGKPTRWARFSPQELNYSLDWFVERGLNSLSMLSYLMTAWHITDDEQYKEIADSLITNHSYLQNMIDQKVQQGIGTGNQSDDEMAFMCYYNIIKYEPDQKRKEAYAASMNASWQLEAPEMNPFFNIAFAASCTGLTFTDAFGTYPLDPDGDWLEDAVETLVRFPLDRFDWRHTNHHRLDLVRTHPRQRTFDSQIGPHEGMRVNGKVIPVDECHFNFWNRNPYRFDTGGAGKFLADGAVYLLPYYMALYHGYVKEQ